MEAPTKTFTRPKPMSKTELREMLRQAVENTQPEKQPKPRKDKA